MSLLGFDKILRGIDNVEKEFLRKGINLARREFSDNFEGEKSAESGANWEEVKRSVPPPILVRTGALKAEAIASGRVTYVKGSARLTVDPIDRFGRPYAQYHQDGIGVKKREYITQSDKLTDKQVELLIDILDDHFK